MADPKQPQSGKPASAPPAGQKRVYGATQSDAGATPPVGKTPPARAPAQGAAARYGATTADQSAATPAGGPRGSGYQIIALIGEGGMGQVHLARDASLDRLVALKRIGREHVTNERLRQRFLTEARASSQLAHYHIVQVYRLGEDADGLFIAMEYVPGPLAPRRPNWPADAPKPPLDLEELVKLKGPLSVANTTKLGRQLLSAVAHAHKNGVIHRDVKPANVLLTRQWQPKLADFGLARQVHAGNEARTMAGAQLLSLGYGAPEQEIDASKADERADLYAVAATLWFALTGHSPRLFRESEVPLPLRAVLVRGLQKDREKRFPTAAEFEEALEKIASQPAIPVAALAPAGPVAGRCPKCGHVHVAANALSALKFCEHCGIALTEACTKCTHANGIWAKFCGSCGVDITANAQRVIGEATAGLASAQELVRQGDFPQALEKLAHLAGLKHPRLVPIAAQAKHMVESTEAAYAKAQAERDEKLQLAQQHVAAHQFEKAAVLLAQVPVLVQTEALKSLARRVRDLLAEKERLKQEIARQASDLGSPGLMAKVERMIALNPHEKYYPDLLNRLAQHAQKATARARDAAQAQATRKRRLKILLGVFTLLGALVLGGYVFSTIRNKPFVEAETAVRALRDKSRSLSKNRLHDECQALLAKHRGSLTPEDSRFVQGLIEDTKAAWEREKERGRTYEELRQASTNIATGQRLRECEQMANAYLERFNQDDLEKADVQEWLQRLINVRSGQFFVNVKHMWIPRASALNSPLLDGFDLQVFVRYNGAEASTPKRRFPASLNSNGVFAINTNQRLGPFFPGQGSLDVDVWSFGPVQNDPVTYHVFDVPLGLNASLRASCRNGQWVTVQLECPNLDLRPLPPFQTK